MSMGEASFKKEESQKHFSLFLALFYCSVEEIQHLGKTGAWIWEQEDWLLQYQKKKIVPEATGLGRYQRFLRMYQQKFGFTNKNSRIPTISLHLPTILQKPTSFAHR
ncbi:hypothetical protein A6P54_05460 [Bacillus sp. MKU004]|nr:hypothetical protein A6P54_05460 [Bacillus sp. MKU004]